jgi:hypothetical protein
MTPTKTRWPGAQVRADRLQHRLRIVLAGEFEVERTRLVVEQHRQQLVVGDIRTVRRVVITPPAGVDADPGALGFAEPTQYLIVEVDELP